MENNYHEITIKNAHGGTMTLRLFWDADIHEWIRNFRIVLKWLTFDDKLVEETFPEEEE